MNIQVHWTNKQTNKQKEHSPVGREKEQEGPSGTTVRPVASRTFFLTFAKRFESYRRIVLQSCSLLSVCSQFKVTEN